MRHIVTEMVNVGTRQVRGGPQSATERYVLTEQ